MGSTGVRTRNPFVAAVFWLTIVFLYAPLAYLVFQAFLVNPNNPKSGFTLKWIEKLMHSPSLWGPLITSLEIAFAAASLSVVIGTLGALGVTRRRKELPAGLQTLVMLPILVPEVITGLPLLLLFLMIRLPLGAVTVVLAHASFSASFVYFIVLEQLRKLDPSLEEAALDLGAKPEEVFWKVTLPNVIPGVAGGWLLAFTISFDDFLISFFTGGAGLTTLPLKIYSLMRIGTTPDLSGLSLVMILFSGLLVAILFSTEQSRKWALKG